jgi:hypothetical protein
MITDSNQVWFIKMIGRRVQEGVNIPYLDGFFLTTHRMMGCLRSLNNFVDITLRITP